MRLPGVPGPRDVLALAEQLTGLVPRLAALLSSGERLIAQAEGLLARIDETRATADANVARIGALLDRLEPSLRTLEPTLARLAQTTDPREVDALISLVDRLPMLAEQVERDVVPVMRTLGTVAPDLHDLLETSRELNEMLAKLPGINRLRD